MDIERVFRMKEGVGEKSYASNSSLQKKAFDMVKHITIEAILDFYITTNPDTLAIADLGCSSGPNTLSAIREIIHAVKAISRRIRRPLPEFRVSLNDLPSNDFNSIFIALPDLYQEFEQDIKNGALVFISAVPGSFYGRLFPANTLDFVHSSYSLHWLSKVPPGLYDAQGKSLNKGKVYISEKSCPLVIEAYQSQFHKDFQLFLQSRSKEVIPGGRMVLTFLGRKDDQDHNDRGNSFFWELLSRSLEVLVAQGAIQKDKLDSYDVHFYAPSKYEIEEQVRKAGLFTIDCLEMFEIERDQSGRAATYGKSATATVRAIQECMITKHFGEEIIDRLFEIYENLVEEELAQQDINPVTFILVLTKSI